MSMIKIVICKIVSILWVIYTIYSYLQINLSSILRATHIFKKYKINVDCHKRGWPPEVYITQAPVHLSFGPAFMSFDGGKLGTGHCSKIFTQLFGPGFINKPSFRHSSSPHIDHKSIVMLGLQLHVVATFVFLLARSWLRITINCAIFILSPKQSVDIAIYRSYMVFSDG